MKRISVIALAPAFGVATFTNQGLEDAVAAWLANEEMEHGEISEFDTSGVTDLSNLFYGAADFNEDISAWDTSSVTSLRNTFRDAAAFDVDLNNWDVSKVTDMAYAFKDAKNFHEPLSTWDTSSVTTLYETSVGAQAPT